MAAATSRSRSIHRAADPRRALEQAIFHRGREPVEINPEAVLDDLLAPDPAA